MRDNRPVTTGFIRRFLAEITGLVLLAGSFAAPATAAGGSDELLSAFDRTLGTEIQAPRRYGSVFEASLAAAASAQLGRIGVAAIDLSSGRSLAGLRSRRKDEASTTPDPAPDLLPG